MPRNRRNQADSNTAKIVFIIGTVLVLFFCFMASAVQLENEREIELKEGHIPAKLMLGVGSSSYQIEGAWNIDGKGISILDFESRRNASWTVDSTNGDIACDSYHKTQEDISLLKTLGVQFYRFSISWVRILPTGDPTNINRQGIKYYNDLIDGLIRNNIIPVVTMYHWELPQSLQELGGWTNSVISDYFEDYANLLFREFGDRVKWWITLNELQIASVFGYGQDDPRRPTHPPSVKHPGVADYLSVHNMLLSHARVYSLYTSTYKISQNGKIGIACNIFNYKPYNNDSRHVEAAERAFLFEGGWILDPIVFGGDYPEEMRKRINDNSQAEGRFRSRLPHFTVKQKQMLAGSLNFIGLNYYSSYLARDETEGASPSYRRDSATISIIDPRSKTSTISGWLTHEPDGLRNVLKWLSKRYPGIPVFITENGCDDTSADDHERVEYHQGHLKATLAAIKEDKVDVIGYTIWSFLDSFEWTSGYGPKFGIYHVDFNSPNRTRTAKLSFPFFQNLFVNRTINYKQ